MTASFVAQFAAEVERLLGQEPGVRITDVARLESEMRKAGAAIERLLDRLETNGAARRC